MAKKRIFERMMRKAIFVALMLLAALSVSAQQQVTMPELPTTYADIIKLFPSNLRNGFEGIFITLTTFGDQSEADAVEVLKSYYQVHWMKEEVILKGKGSTNMPDSDKTFGLFYSEMRAALIANVGRILPAILMTGNPGGVRNWDNWGRDLMEWM